MTDKEIKEQFPNAFHVIKWVELCEEKAKLGPKMFPTAIEKGIPPEHMVKVFQNSFLLAIRVGSGKGFLFEHKKEIIEEMHHLDFLEYIGLRLGII